MAILLSLMVRLIADHLSIPDMLLAGAEKPLILRVAIVILALFLLGVLLPVLGGFSGVEWCGMVPGGILLSQVGPYSYCLKASWPWGARCRGGGGAALGILDGARGPAGVE